MSADPTTPNAWTISLGSYVQPAVGQDVDVPAISAWVAGGQVLFVEGGGYYRVTGVHTGAPSINLTNLGISGVNASPGATIGAGAKITPAGEVGADGSSGTDGAGAVQGIGTVASPGILRATIGPGPTAVTVGGFWSLADAGGGTFYWDAASSEADDGGTVIQPTLVSGAGRWKRIYAGDLHVEWFGARGDGSRVQFNTSGHDDADAIQAAIDVAKVTHQSVKFDARKTYRVERRTGAALRAPILDCSLTKGLTLDGTGGPKLGLTGAWIVFTGKHTGALISAKSTYGFGMRGLQLVAWSVAPMTTVLEGLTVVYANAAARVAASAGFTAADRGKIARDTDTGSRFVSRWDYDNSVNVWDPEAITILEFSHAYYNGVAEDGTLVDPALELSSGDTSQAHVEKCVFSGANTTTYTYAGIRLSHSYSMLIEHCQFANLQVGISGVDPKYGGGFSNLNTISKCGFNRCNTAAIRNPLTGFSILGGFFETNADNTVGSILIDSGGCISPTIVGNGWEDATGGTCISAPSGITGGIIQGNFAELSGAATFLALGAGIGLVSKGNYLGLQSGYVLSGSTSNLEIGPDRFSGTTYFAGTGYANSRITTDNGVSFGNVNTLGGIGNFAVGSGNTLTGTRSSAFGELHNSSALDSATFGAAGTCKTPCTIGLGGGQALGIGGSACYRSVFTKVMLPGHNDTVPNGGGGTGIVGTAKHVYFVRASYIATDELATQTKRFAAVLDVVACRDNAGTMTIVSQTMNSLLDSDATGCTVDATASGGDIGFRLSNATAGNLNVVVMVDWIEAASA